MNFYPKRKAGRRSKHSHSFKLQAAKYILENDMTHREGAKHFNTSHGTINRWIILFRSEIEDLKSIGTMAALSPTVHGDDNCNEQTKSLQKALDLAQLKVTGLETMIDLAESTYKISIRKNFGTKQHE